MFFFFAYKIFYQRGYFNEAIPNKQYFILALLGIHNCTFEIKFGVWLPIMVNQHPGKHPTLRGGHLKDDRLGEHVFVLRAHGFHLKEFTYKQKG